MSELDNQIQNRREKLEALRGAGVEGYPNAYEHDLEPAAVHDRFGDLDAASLEERAIELRVPGRLRALRSHGKTGFADLHDGRVKLQVMLRAADLDAASSALLESLDLGDYVGASGRLIRTRTGELTLQARTLTLLSKALRPLPEKWHGLADVEQRYRRRYLDLVMNPESRRVFEVRARAIRSLREALEAEDFLEVETPMMQVLPGGAVARPFVTHHSALDIDLYLRIAPELYLKRLLVGGLHRVYEINRNFRNEGLSTQHNPEFTMLEFYWAYVEHERLMRFTEETLRGLAAEVLGEARLEWKGKTLDLEAPWRRMSVRDAVEEACGAGPGDTDDVDGLARLAAARGVDLPAGAPYGNALMALFEATVEADLDQPTFVTGLPVEVSPLAKASTDDPRFTDRFELYLGGMELANGFSELNDPEAQAERFRQQLSARELGDDEAHRFDHDYIRALEHGMPPAAGEGVGIDRLTMLLTGRTSIRDVILFPTLRPEADEDAG
ncbi:MAG: lysine--tRNA ligase [Thermoanaerobaculia bacterium]